MWGNLYISKARVAIKPANGSYNIPSYSLFSNSNFWHGAFSSNKLINPNINFSYKSCENISNLKQLINS